MLDPNTRLPGLVAADTPLNELRVRPDPHAFADVRALQKKLTSARGARAATNVLVGIVLGLLALFAALARSAVLARAAVLYAPAAIGLGLATRSWWVIGFGALPLAFGAAVPRRAFRPLLVVVLAGALLVLWRWPETNALATIGPHPDGGGRFYGLTNQVETMLLAPALLAGPAAAPLALLMVGWSKAGADGGGLLVYAVAYAVAAVGATRRRVAVALAAAAALGAILVALDAATGGSSHVTHALGSGLPGDLAHRWRVSYDGATRSVGELIMFASGIAILGAVALTRPRYRRVDAMLVALLVSFVVNDTPTDVSLWGSLGVLAVLGFERAWVG
ncbi:MAG: hypothetical protein ACYDA3_10805 [Gaiellaceae bacterium]